MWNSLFGYPESLLKDAPVAPPTNPTPPPSLPAITFRYRVEAIKPATAKSAEVRQVFDIRATDEMDAARRVRGPNPSPFAPYSEWDRMLVITSVTRLEGFW